MPFSSIIAYFTSNSAFKKLSQKQNEALVRTLAYAQAIDGAVAESEQKILVKATKGLNWQGSYSLEEFVVRSEERRVGKECSVASVAARMIESGQEAVGAE